MATVTQLVTASAICNRLLGSFPWRTTSPDKFLREAEEYQQALDGGINGMTSFCRQKVEELKREGKNGNIHSLGHAVTWEGITDAVVRYGQTLQ